MLQAIPLRKQRDYRLLWSARTTSITGSEVSRLAVPLTAVTMLAASPTEMGLLTSAAAVPALLLGLQAGAIADRLKKHRPIMIACELASALAAVSVPVGWFLGVLTVPWLIAVALIIGSASVLFKAANFQHLAAVVDPTQRTAAMAGFQASYSAASVAGPGLAGLLVQLLTAPLAVLVEAFSFLASALMLRSIRTHEDHTPADSKGMWRDIVEGLRFSTTHPVIRSLLGAGTTINFFATAYIAVHMLYMVNTLQIPQGMLGVLIAVSGIGGLLGAWATTRLAKRFGENRILLATVLFFPMDILLVGLLHGSLAFKITVLAASSMVIGAVVVSFATCLGAIVMREAPAEVRGRVNATMTFAVQGVMALGGVFGGLLAEQVGLRSVILICAVGIALSSVWVWASPLRPRRPLTLQPRQTQPTSQAAAEAHYLRIRTTR